MSQILIVEDDRDVRAALHEALEIEGYAVATAAHGGEAVAFLERASPLPCVVLLDLMMPVMDGFALLDRMRRDPVWGSVPVYVLTADGRVENDVVVPPVRGLLKKPVRLLEILSIARTLCR